MTRGRRIAAGIAVGLLAAVTASVAVPTASAAAASTSSARQTSAAATTTATATTATVAAATALPATWPAWPEWLAGAVRPAPAARPLPVSYDAASGYLLHAATPDDPAPGAIAPDASGRLAACRDPAHPPVILVHGTWANQSLMWQAGAPLLRNAGLCVYSFNYGGDPDAMLFGTGPIARSAVELGGFVNRVLAVTGSRQVDLVGVSQGGMMPRYYLKFGGSYHGGSFGVGLPKVRRLVALAPSNHGTSASGLRELGDALGVTHSGLLPAAATDQLVGSAFLTTLDSCPKRLPAADVCAGDRIDYTVITTRDDEIVTPYTNALLRPNPRARSRVTNVVLQDTCRRDHSDHVSIAYDSYAWGFVLRALDLDPATVPGASPSCRYVAPFLGG